MTKREPTRKVVTVDRNGVRVLGLPPNGRGTARAARVFTLDGRLYVARSPTDVLSFPLSEGEPVIKGWGGEAAGIRWHREGCGCKVNKALGQIPQDELAAQAAEEVMSG